MKQLSEITQRLAYLLLKDQRYNYYTKLKKNITISKEEMEHIQNALINKIITDAYNHSKYYKKLFDKNRISIRDIKTKADLKKLPILTKDIIKNNFDDIISDQYQKDKLIEVTSGGSTGNQSVILKSPFFEQMGRAAMLRNNLLAHWEPSDRAVWIWGAPYEHQATKLSLKSRLGIIINNRILFNAYRYSPIDFPQWVKQINKLKPSIIYGYASIILEFSRYILENKSKLPNLKSVITTTETLQQRDVISRAFGCNVYNQYGCREIPAIAIESEPDIMHIADDNVALNIYENNDIIITALHSFGFPLINYKLGDCGNVHEGATPVTDLPFSTMRLTIGRITDNFLTRSGEKVSSSALSTYISTLKPSVVEHQIIQCDYTRFVVNYIPSTSFNIHDYKSLLHKVLAEYFGDPVDVDISCVNHIPVEKSGKKLMFKRTFELDS